ncbi:MAG TPA: DUF6328 family protein [Blastocatellia bacterium]|nr:DUF6328 family protein [Blastocatellia bacterium]
MFWYGLEFIKRRHRRIPKPPNRRGSETNGNDDRSEELTALIHQVLTEARVVIPGAQALLGFQLTIALTSTFEALPRSSKYVHLASLGMMALSLVFLMTPAAYHRIVERGDSSWVFLGFSRKMLLAAMVPLPLGISGDFFVVSREVCGPTAVQLRPP